MTIIPRWISMLACMTIMATRCISAEPAPVPDRFNYGIGTQTIGASYQFTQRPGLLETAQAIADMGSNCIKFALEGRYADPKMGYGLARNPAIHALADLARDEPTVKAVLDMPFAYYILWATPIQKTSWKKGFSDADRQTEYREMHDLAAYLLKTYSGSGKTFLLGHWEGDWLLRAQTKPSAEVTPTAAAGMIDWLNTRQLAIDDAKRETAHHDVSIFNYTEVNLVQIGIQGKPCLTNDVLPKTHVDYVSYSSYDSQKDPAKLKAALDYIESKLPPKPGIAGKRVFIGEYGFPACFNSPEKQDAMSRQVMRTGLEWGCPWILYWELYNNEIDPQGKQRGFWLIDDKGAKQPVYNTHQRLYRWARQYVADFTKEHRRQPTFDEYRQAAIVFLDQIVRPTPLNAKP